MNNSAEGLASGYVFGGLGPVAWRQDVDNSAGSLAFGYVPGGLGPVAWRQDVIAGLH